MIVWRAGSGTRLLSFFFFLLQCNFCPEARAANRSTVDVGVILKTSSWIGNISWSCMTMALDDFYAAHPNYTTRLKFHLRETDASAFGAAAAALDLLKNVQVQAVIGPQTSPQAKFVTELGQKTHVPFISFSAKSPSISPKKNPYFIRTGLDDSSQASVIASIIKEFNWKDVVLVSEDTDYGNGLTPYLVDALDLIEADVSYKASLSPSASNDQIMAELLKLKSRQTRVFVVHMTYSLGLQLFMNAKQARMMDEGYVWITTYGLTDLVDLIGSPASDVMQGVLGVKPYVNGTEMLNDFKQRWKQKFNQVDPSAKISDPTVFGLWAYDTVWALALAVEKAGVTNSTFQQLKNTDNSTDTGRLGSSLSGPSLRNQILNTTFDGINGEFGLIDGELVPKAFEIINVVGNGRTTVGYWTPAYNISGNVNSKKNMTNIMWPGRAKVQPKGWEWPTMGRALKIGIPVKPGFVGFIESSRSWPPKGYCIEVFDAVMDQLPYHVDYKYFKYQDDHGNMKGTYDELIYQVYTKEYDAVVGDVTIISNRSLSVDFTLPYTESGVSMVVPIKDKRNKGALTFLEPLTTDLWLASMAFFVYTGFVVWFLEHRINNEFRGTASNQLGTIFYFAFSTLVFSHREKVVSNLTRVVVIIWVFVVLVLQSSYTASLSSKLTVEQLQPTITDINELLKNGASVGYLDDSFMPALLMRLGFNESKLNAYQSPEDYDAVLSNGTVAAIFDEIPYLKVFLSQYCNKYTMTGPTYKTDGFGFAFPRGSPLVADVSRAVLKVMEGENMTRFEHELYGDGNCSDPESDSETSSSLRVSSFWVLFLITGITSSLAVIIHLGRFLYKHRDLLQRHDDGNSVSRKLASLAKLYDQMDPSRATNKEEEKETFERPTVIDVMPSPCSVSEPQSLSGISTPVEESFEIEEEEETLSDEEGISGREISSHYPPSFAEMLTPRASVRSP